MSSDGLEMYKDYILSVIDQLRSRKARPDMERICHFVERKYGLSRAETETHVEKLVDTGDVIKVVYKRGTSYRNAAKSRRKSHYGTNVLNSTNASLRISEAVRSILNARRKKKYCDDVTATISDVIAVSADVKIEPNEDAERALPSDVKVKVEPKEDAERALGLPLDVKVKVEPNEEERAVPLDEDLEEGVNSREIETWLSERAETEADDLEPFICPIHVIIQREVEAGRLRRLENGNVVPRAGPSKIGALMPKTAMVTDNTGRILQKSVSVVAKRGRPPKKQPPIARSLSVGDVPCPLRPEDQVAPLPVMPPHVCDFCQKPSDHNRSGEDEELLFCKDCNAKAHPSCMQYSPELAKRARNTAWQCIDCKTCCICFDPGEADCMLFCDACDKGYHMMCHEPNVDEKPQGKWICNECVQDGVDVGEEINNNMVDSTVRSTDSESLSSNTTYDERKRHGRHRKFRCSTNGSPSPPKVPKLEEEVYPDASRWSVSDVVAFFQQRGFIEQADAFKDQEIDGQSLLLLKRSDVLQGLSLKLGPALKMYNYVMKLQTAGQPCS